MGLGEWGAIRGVFTCEVDAHYVLHTISRLATKMNAYTIYNHAMLIFDVDQCISYWRVGHYGLVIIVKMHSMWKENKSDTL